MKTKPPIPERKTIPVSCNKDCAAGCPLLAHVEDGKIVKITDNPNGTPYMKGCSKGFQAMKAAYAPDRLLKPLIRTGLRGSGDYKEVSWDEALDYVAAGNMAKSRWERNGSSGRSKHSYVDKANRTMYGISDTLGTGGG